MEYAGGDGDEWIGRVIDGRYRVLDRAGTGGMGVVYRVEHVRMGKVAAMKVLHRALACDPAAVRRFRREVQVVSRLDHPNIVQTFDCGEADGQLYLIMEYVRGEDLGGILWREGPLPPARALALALQIASALEEAHEHGVIHCDLKPDNIVCAHRRGLERAKVLDFGLATLRDGPEPEQALFGGTPSYMSPEQIRAEPVDARSDLYSLGATLYRMLTGETPFEGGTPLEVMKRHLTEPLLPPSARAPGLALPAAVDQVVMWAMARDPAERPRHAGELRDQLGAVLQLVAGPLPLAAARGEDSDSDLNRLRREDLEAFEGQVRRRRRLATFLIAPLALAALVMVGGVALALVRPGPTGGEHEPNDLPALATPLSRGRPVRGAIGAPHADGRPDFDYYRIPGGARARTLTVRISGVPGLDLVLELYDESGHLLARANAAPAGNGEQLGPLALGPGPALLRARPLWTAGATPASAPATPYDLTADWGPKPRAKP